ncbi:MAG TPA: glucose-6-phosphate dehydrogenase assembly protein OpcA [Halomicronema sp.]
MTVQTAPIYSLQAPKDVSIADIEAELSKIWQSYSGIGDDDNVPAATRAATFSLLVYEPEETQHLLAALGYYTGPIDGIGGPRMEAALAAAQKTYGLPITTKPNKETLAKLREAFAASRAGVDGKKGSNGKAHYSADSKSTIADEIASRNPCRIITLCPVSGEDEGVSAQVSAYCPINKQSSNTLICCEYITLKGTVEALERVGGMIGALLIGELPKFLWWKASPDLNMGLFKRLAEDCNSVIVDSSAFNDPQLGLLRVQALIDAGIAVADLNWRRLAPWQELSAEAFDPPERRAAIYEVDRVTIDYEKGNPTQALMFLGWLASRLGWMPISSVQEDGDYQIKRITFQGKDQQHIEAELAAIPTADWGDIPGDLISLRLTSTNEQADCCTVLCSQTTGCMRMEAKGGAQACRIQQVAPRSDQKAEILLSQQLQRWGREMLYEESLAVTAQILKIGS